MNASTRHPDNQPESSSVTEWYYVVGEERRGPVSEQSLIAIIKSGGIGPTSKIWKGGLPKWIILENTGFVEFLPQACPPPLDQVETEDTNEEGGPTSVSNLENAVVQTSEPTKQYKIYENKAGIREAIKQGWSWPAFFFTFIWAFIKKLNGIGAGVLAGWICLMAIAGAMGSNDEETAAAINGLVALANIAILVIFGVNGNAWREKNLLSRGYQLKRTVAAETDEAALSRYMEEAESDSVR